MEGKKHWEQEYKKTKVYPRMGRCKAPFAPQRRGQSNQCSRNKAMKCFGNVEDDASCRGVYSSVAQTPNSKVVRYVNISDNTKPKYCYLDITDKDATEVVFNDVHESNYTAEVATDKKYREYCIRSKGCCGDGVCDAFFEQGIVMGVRWYCLEDCSPSDGFAAPDPPYCTCGYCQGLKGIDGGASATICNELGSNNSDACWATFGCKYNYLNSLGQKYENCTCDMSTPSDF